MRKESGFTLIELMVTVSVLAVLLGVGVPSMIDFMDTNRRAAAVNALVNDLQRARSTAASRGENVVVCRATDSTGCASNGDWADGWLVFLDDEGDGVLSLGLNSGDEILAVQGPRTGLNMPGSVTRFTYTANALSLSGVGGSVAVCLDGPENDRWIAVASTGRPRLQTFQGNLGVAC